MDSCATGGAATTGKTTTTAAEAARCPYAGEASIIAALIFKTNRSPSSSLLFFGELLLQAGIFLGDGTCEVLFVRYQFASNLSV